MKIPRPLDRIAAPAWPAPPQCPEVLDGFGLAEHVMSLCGDMVDEEYIEDFFRDRVGTLTWVPLETLQEGPKDNNIRNAELEKRYAKMSSHTTPPLVIDNGQVVDGNHRYRVARALQLPGLWCYVLGWADDSD